YFGGPLNEQSTFDRLLEECQGRFAGRQNIRFVLANTRDAAASLKAGDGALGGFDLIYVDEKGAYAFIEGQLIDLKNNKNITRERTEELSSIQFKDLPLSLAFKQVQGNGRRVMAVFEDPNCGYCRKLRADLAGIKDVTIYTFVLPLLSPDSEVKSRNALCAADKAKAWNDMMLSGKAPPNAAPSCDAPIAKLKELGRSLAVTGTPTVFFPNGKRLTGYAPMTQFEKMLEDNNRL
ncbi:MAG: DsbC family protein, partial [Betaproteobacteria bacterium]|nr:DsbC family protein [Betaproteobacteria bacterium]